MNTQTRPDIKMRNAIGIHQLHWLFFWNAALVMICCSGCMERKIQTEYGRASGDGYSQSVNGTVVFHKMIESTDHQVDRYTKFSPRWERYQTAFWIPDSFGPPSEEVIDHIEAWLAGDSWRRLIYVARDFDAAEIYWQTLRENESQNDKRDDLSRQFFEATTDHLKARQVVKPESCAWYDTVQHPYSQAKTIAGELVDGLDTSMLDIRYRSLPAPGNVRGVGEFGDYQVEELMSVDGYPFIYTLTKPRFQDSHIVIVGNASFLLNLPLTNDANRSLASEFIYLALENEYSDQDVLFIESKNRLPISDRDAPDRQSQWHWITKKPLRYIVPNIFFCCLLFCFVYFPIFGRPKRIKQRSTANFRDHIDALGQLIRKTKSRELPGRWIDEYRRRSTTTRGNVLTGQDDEKKTASNSQNETNR